MRMNNRKKFIAPIVIAGITVGFLVSAYRFIFSDQKDSVLDPTQPDLAPEQPQADAQSEDATTEDVAPDQGTDSHSDQK